MCAVIQQLTRVETIYSQQYLYFWLSPSWYFKTNSNARLVFFQLQQKSSKSPGSSVASVGSPNLKPLKTTAIPEISYSSSEDEDFFDAEEDDDDDESKLLKKYKV